jgi:hypothetical protein
MPLIHWLYVVALQSKIAALQVRFFSEGLSLRLRKKRLHVVSTKDKKTGVAFLLMALNSLAVILYCTVRADISKDIDRPSGPA